MKLIRRRRSSLNTVLGITKAKRKIARITGIPTTKACRKRKALNTLTGGAYGRYQRTRAAINRPYKTIRRATKPGCLVSIMGCLGLMGIILLFILG